MHAGSTTMTDHDQPSGTKPVSSASEPVPITPGHGSNAVGFLLARGLDSRRESLRITVGLVTLVALSVSLLNLGIYQSAERNQARQSWDRLASSTESKRDDVRNLLQQFEHQARHVAGQPALRSWASRAATGSLAPQDRSELEAELARSVRNFEFGAAQVLASDGRVLVQTAGGGEQDPTELRVLLARCLGTGTPVLGDLHRAQNESRLLAAMVPLGDPSINPATPVALFTVEIQQAIQPRLRDWSGFGPVAGAYLVRQDRDHVVFLTSPPIGPDGRTASQVPSSDPQQRAAVMAAVGVESSVEVSRPDGPTLWSVTRFLPEVGWGLVGQADRSVLAEGLRGTLFGLLVLDLAMGILAGLVFWFWRRRYASGLAERESEVTRRHAERVQSVFDTAFDAIMTFDHQGRVRTVNRAAEALFLRSAEEMEGEPIHRFLHRALATKAGPQGSDGRSAVTYSEALRVDGTTVPVEFSLGSAGDGEDLLHTAIVRDVSERVEAESRIRAFAEGLEVSNRRLEEMNAQLEEASRLKSEFLANTSHELRTPLNGMIGFLQLVLDGMCDSRDEEREFLRQGLECSRHLLGLINDVLDIAKIEAGKLALEIEPVDVQQLFDEVYTVTHVQASQKGITLRFEPPATGAGRARGDIGKTKQILINLVGNSLKFTPRGSITVRATEHAELGHFMFEVKDTGIGISPARQKLVFEKFTQGDGTTTRKYGGTGLGLAISRSLVELMGGIIGVQSEGEGKGTRTYFSLPTWSAERELAPTEPSDGGDRIEGPPGGALVLVVEDDAIFRNYLATLLHHEGYRTVEAPHAEGGWLLARRLRPAVVVLDYALACLEGATLRTGWDLAERMTTDNLTRHIPLIFVTGFDDELREKLKATAFARKPVHLMKPIDGSALLARIQELLGSVDNRIMRILMADDDPSVAAYVRKVLPVDRFHIEMTANGEECLHALRTQPRGFDLLLLDLMMPQVSGYDVLKEMTLTGLGQDLPVLVLTNYPDPRDDEEKRLIEDGLVLDVLPKSAVHDNPQLLPHVIGWHMQVVGAREAASHGDEAARRAA